MALIEWTRESWAMWRKHTLDFLKSYPEFGRFHNEETYRKIDGSRAASPLWAAEEIERMEDLLRRLRAWDMLDAAGDGPYWKTEIDKVIDPFPPKE